MIKERITDINIYAPSNRAPKYMKKKLTELKREINNSIILAGDFNTPLSVIEQFDKISKEIEDLNITYIN